MFALLAAAACFSARLAADEILNPGGEDVPKIEVTSSMLGYRDTLRFYILDEGKAVLRVQIGNKDTKFPVTARLYTFDEGVGDKEVRKWINNQHSDGLFADAPEPAGTHEIPPASCQAKSHKLIKEVEEHFGKFKRYKVTFEIKNVPPLGGHKVKDFTDEATVHVKTAGR
ncbi:MAG: hypothetical protein HKO57_05710 [Akkermansiaceae bacterium]|nr:hypothetical protein [Akkermansiaceae bacterium]